MISEDIRVQTIRQLSPRTLGITWTDGRQDAFDVVELRRRCPCAQCIDEWTGAKRLDPQSIPDTVRPLRLESVGSYALQIWFNDGHSTGIYTFALLRQLATPTSQAAH